MPRIWEKHCWPCAEQPGCIECSLPLGLYLLGDTDLAGPVKPTQKEPVAVCGFELGAQKGPSGSSVGDGNCWASPCTAFVGKGCSGV